MGLSTHQMYRFMTVGTKLWSPDMGYPHAADIRPSAEPPEAFKGKLNGDFVWPFSMDLPRTVTLNRGPSDMYNLPGSVKTYRVSVNYNISVMVIRGMFSTEHM